MKKIILFALAALGVMMTSIVWAAPGHENAATRNEYVSQDVSQRQDERESGRCDCGGKLSWTAKAIAHRVECPVCHGKGYLEGGGMRFTCSYCEGTREVIEWEDGYVCGTCGNVYKEW